MEITNLKVRNKLNSQIKTINATESCFTKTYASVSSSAIDLHKVADANEIWLDRRCNDINNVDDLRLSSD